MAIFESKKSSNDIIKDDTMSDDDVVASDVPSRYLFAADLRQKVWGVGGNGETREGSNKSILSLSSDFLVVLLGTWKD